MLLDSATVPDIAQLPADLVELHLSQAMLFRRASVDDDAEKIARRLRHLIAENRRRGLSYVSAGAAAAVALAAGIWAGHALLPDPAPLAGPELRARLDKAVADVKQLGSERNAMQSKLGAAEEQLGTARSALAKAEQEREAARVAAAQSAEALKTAEKKLNEEAAARRSAEARFVEAAKAREEALAQAKTAKAEAEDWRKKHAALEPELKRLTGLWQDERQRADAAARKLEASAPARKTFSTSRATRPLTADEATALREDKDNTYRGSVFRECDVCPEMVVVPSGRFTRGSPPEEKGYSDEGPQRPVTIARSFAVGRFEVTFAEWDACVAAGGCTHRPTTSWERGKQPVINVSWDDAQQYVGWLSRRTGKTYRLLTEAEWEYAARAGTTTPYAFGATISKSQAQFSADRTAEVGSFHPNAFGLYDMHGNVWEWVQDCYQDNYNGAPTDGSARAKETACRRVLRGGSWYVNPRFLRSASRNRVSSDFRGGFLGFRVGRTL